MPEKIPKVILPSSLNCVKLGLPSSILLTSTQWCTPRVTSLGDGVARVPEAPALQK